MPKPSKGQDTWQRLHSGGRAYSFIDLPQMARACGLDLEKLPFSIRVLLENLLRHGGQGSTDRDRLADLAARYRPGGQGKNFDIIFHPARILMQDFTGVPAIVDLAAMRDAVALSGMDPRKIAPLCPVDLVVDHSLSVDVFASADAFKRNVEREFERNHERYAFLRWGQESFANLRVVPPGMGICHQVNLEYLAKVVWQGEDGNGGQMLYPDTVLGTDSHTTMINGLGVLGWGVGGIEAEAALLGQGYSMACPDVIGVRLEGCLGPAATATDLVLHVTQVLREYGVVGKFVEFTGTGYHTLSVADRATVANMSPEYGATCGFFPIDAQTCAYLRATGRPSAHVALVEEYAKAQGLWRDDTDAEPVFTDIVPLDMSKVEPSLAGPKRPQDKVLLSDAARSYRALEPNLGRGGKAGLRQAKIKDEDWLLSDGDIVIAAITSCTNTSNPATMMAAGLLARHAVARGLRCAPWVKTSLAPGSRAVSAYLDAAGLLDDLACLGFHVVGYGCTTCIGNSGPLPPKIAEAVRAQDLNVVSVLSGNRNFEGRIHPQTRANYLASPPLVVAYALAGSIKNDMIHDPIGHDRAGKPVFLADLWPKPDQINALIEQCLSSRLFRERYDDVFSGTDEWQSIAVPEGVRYAWDEKSTYVRNPPFFQPRKTSAVLTGLRPLLILGDSVTTDHISPAGTIAENSPAADYLRSCGVHPGEFNSYGSRRGNHEVMMRGTFANIRIRNHMTPGQEGGVTMLYPEKKQMSVYDAAVRYRQRGTPLIVVAGKEYGSGSSRDWAAKGVRLLGVDVVLAESFERIHRSNLIGMGVLPLQMDGATKDLVGDETFDISGLEKGICPGMEVSVRIHRKEGEKGRPITRPAICRIDTEDEKKYYESGGILPYVVKRIGRMS